MAFMDFLKESTDSSSKRLVLVMAGVTMSIAILVLVYVAYANGKDVSNELWALTIPLSTMAGVSYAAVERMRLAKKDLASVKETIE